MGPDKETKRWLWVLAAAAWRAALLHPDSRSHVLQLQKSEREDTVKEFIKNPATKVQNDFLIHQRG
jgi:hypothetical protein